MASNFVPMHSSSPPPLDDCPDDDDDEFGNFASANIAFDSSFDSPVATSKLKSFKTGDNGVNDLNLRNNFSSLYSGSDPDISNHINDVSHQHKIINIHKSKQITCDDEEPPFPDVNYAKNNVSCDTKSVISSASCDAKSVLSSASCDASSVLSSSDSLDGEELAQSSEPIHLKLCSDDGNISDNNLDGSHYFENQSLDSVSTPVETTINSKFSFHVDTSKHQSKPCGLFNNSNYSDGVAKSEGDQSSDISFECYKENIPVSENVKFPVDFAAEDEFDDFQQAVSTIAQTTEIKSDIVSKESSFYSKTDNKFRTDLKDNEFKTDLKDDEFRTDFKTDDEFRTDFKTDDEFKTDFKTDDESRTDFNNIPDSENCDHANDEEEDFDDFQSFKKATSACIVNNVSKTDSKVSSDDEDFQDFKKCEPVKDELEEFDEFQGCSTTENSGTQGFANFESVSFEEKTQSDSPQFADFESASFSSDESRSNLTCASSSAQDKNLDKIATVLNAIFPTVSESSDDYCDQPAEILEQSNKSHRLWEKLQEVEQAPSLRFQWGVSHSFQQLLRSINVDYHSILRTSSVPIFASSLSLLEPVKGQTKTANAESEIKKKTQNANDPIPPVEFDWTSSGLVNPLDSGQAASVLMDLSFLTSSDTATSPPSNNNSFEKELLKPSPTPACSEFSNKTLILEELLSKNVCSLPNSKSTHRPPNISEEANSVLDQLPDLSFMRAKVLMFPISSKT